MSNVPVHQPPSPEKIELAKAQLRKVAVTLFGEPRVGFALIYLPEIGEPPYIITDAPDAEKLHAVLGDMLDRMRSGEMKSVTLRAKDQNAN